MARAAAAPLPPLAPETALQVTRLNFQKAAKHLRLRPDMQRLLLAPARELCVELPVRLDDGTMQLFAGYRVQHNDARGPVLGGLRFHSNVDAEQIRAFAAVTTWQNAVVGIPFGGAMGGIAVDPSKLSTRELERLTRLYISRIQPMLGPYRDVLAPDVNTDSQTMTWIFDQYSRVHGYAPACVTGKPVEMGGSFGRKEAAGRGVSLMLKAAADDLGMSMEGMRVAVQGFGNVGTNAALLVQNLGARIVAVSDAQGGVYRKQGIEVEALEVHVKAAGRVCGFPGDQTLAGEDVLASDCDALILAAGECVVTPLNAGRIKAKLILEGTGLPITPIADSILELRGITVVPDVLAGAGAAIGSYFEWTQNLEQRFWEKEYVNSELETVLMRAYRQVGERAKSENLSWRTAAYCSALERVARAEKLRAA